MRDNNKNKFDKINRRLFLFMLIKIFSVAYIIERLDDLEGENRINLWPKDKARREILRNWVYDTTITEGVPMGKTLGTAIPLFSMSLIETLIKIKKSSAT